MGKRRGPARCNDCHRVVKWLHSPFSGRWRTFEPEPVNPRAHTGAAAYPTEGIRTWVLREFVEELMVRREQSRGDAEEEAYAYPWHAVHICPTGPTEDQGEGQ